jgi:hypothetical protein
MRRIPIALSCAAVTLCGTAMSQPNVKLAATAAPVAYVYVSTSKGVYLYDAASTGKLALVGGPYSVSGLSIGSNGKYFVSLGTDYVHTYVVASNGAIGKQASQINTQLYNGGDCGTTGGAILDHTGQDIYVLLNNAFVGGSGVCTAYQTFKITSTSGALTFLGAATFDGRFANQSALPTITANDVYGYAVTAFGGYTPDTPMSGLKRESSGALAWWPLSQIDPVAQPGWVFYPTIPVADPSNHLAVAMYPEYEPPFGNTGPIQLASYTVDSQGNLKSTNTWHSMPTPSTGVSVLNMSPSGKLLAVGGPSGLLVYHFNGASPITAYSAKLATVPIKWIHWDNANHLFALSTTGKMYVFSATPTAISPVVGSPYTISNANGLFVVPR